MCIDYTDRPAANWEIVDCLCVIIVELGVETMATAIMLVTE